MNLSKKTFVLSILATLLIGFVGGKFVFSDKDNHNHEVIEEGIWTCAMHPQIKQSEPGKCPICNMELVPLQKEDEFKKEPAGSFFCGVVGTIFPYRH